MKKIVCIMLSLCLIAMLFCGCSKPNDTESNYSDDVIVEQIIIDETSSATSDTSTPSNTETPNETVTPSQDNSSQETPSTVDPANCSHSYDDGKIEQTAQLFKAGTKKYTCTKCGDSYSGAYPVEKLKILAIGHSYSLNSMWQLYDLCKAAGVKEIDIAIMYIAGCSLDAHWENVQKNAASYELYRNNSGSWEITKDYSIETIISEGGWDVVTLQNSPGGAAQSNAFSNLDNMINYVNGKCPDAKVLWHMTWGFQTGSKWLDSGAYPGGEMEMYNNIISNIKQIIETNGKIHSIVPSGTAVMNARTSRLKTIVHQEDGSHLSEDVGYYVGAFTWFGHLTGMPLYDVNLFSLNPTASQNLDVIRECAQNALKNPYQITQSYYTN